jgi:DNA-binding LacI/PurR family transcriptional regulator
MPDHKYQEIVRRLQGDIASGKYKPGQRLPSEAELVRRYSVSRMTVFRAMQELQGQSLVVRRVGSGTFVAQEQLRGGHVFGLLIPELGETEIFESICKGIMDGPHSSEHALLWGNAAASEGRKEVVAEQLCRHYIERKVSGVFFAPLEFSPDRYRSNKRIAAAFQSARIPVVLLDRCLEAYPQRSSFDLVGIDNRRTAFLATTHLQRTGATRIAFFARPQSAGTVAARIAGYTEAVQQAATQETKPMVCVGDATDAAFVRSCLKKHRPDAFLCANDLTAGNLMHTLLALGKCVPEDIKLMGFDDVKYAGLLPVPLTTHRQPCKHIGQVALSLMLERVQQSDLPARDVLLDCNLVVRKSCGGVKA